MNNMVCSIGLCKRAGKLVAGFDGVKEALANHTALLVLLASDLSEKTKKECRFLAEKYDAPILELDSTMEELSEMLRKRTGVLATTDAGFARMLSSKRP